MRRESHVFAVVTLLVALAGSIACKEEGTVTVKKIAFNGVKAVDPARLKAALATRESSVIPWGKKNYFDRSRFDMDLKRIEAFYADRGYPDARVTNFDIKLNDAQDAVEIAMTVHEGDPVRVVSLEFPGFEVIPEEHFANLKSRTPLKIEQPRDRQFVLTTRELALNELRDHGYPYAKITTSEDNGPDGKQASLSFKAEPGALAFFGPVEISGNKTISDNVIRRMMAYKPGDLYRRSLMQTTQRRLYGMDLFQFANVEALNQEVQPVDLPTRITVAEGKHHRVNFGVGYGTEEKARVDAEYHHLNFLGGARTAGAHVRYSSLDRGVRVDFNQPYFFQPHFSLSGQGQYWRSYTPAYASTVKGGKAVLTHRANPNTSWSVSLTSERDTSYVAPEILADPTLHDELIALGLNPITGAQDGTVNAAGFDFQRSTADNLLNAHRGYQIAFHAEQAGHLVPGTFSYYAGTIEGRHYLPLGDNLVVASRVQLGNIRPAGGDQAKVPFGKLFFLGGATSIRGWGRYEVSPLTESGLPTGGDSMFAFSTELRGTLRGKLGGVLFLDGGNVWAKSWDIRLDDLRYAVGPGLRYQTPIGPIRFDFGYQLNPNPDLRVNGEPQTRRWRVHFSIGQAF